MTQFRQYVPGRRKAATPATRRPLFRLHFISPLLLVFASLIVGCSESCPTEAAARDVAMKWAQSRNVFSDNEPYSFTMSPDNLAIVQNQKYWHVIFYPISKYNDATTPNYGLILIIDKHTGEIVYSMGTCAETYDEHYPRPLSPGSFESYFDDVDYPKVVVPEEPSPRRVP